MIVFIRNIFSRLRSSGTKKLIISEIIPAMKIVLPFKLEFDVERIHYNHYNFTPYTSRFHCALWLIIFKSTISFRNYS